MRLALILLAASALASCSTEEERKAAGYPVAVDSTVTDQAGNRRGLVVSSYSDMQARFDVTPVLDPQTGCEYLMSTVHSGVSLTIRYDRTGKPMCPDVPRSAPNFVIDRTK